MWTPRQWMLLLALAAASWVVVWVVLWLTWRVAMGMREVLYG